MYEKVHKMEKYIDKALKKMSKTIEVYRPEFIKEIKILIN